MSKRNIENILIVVADSLSSDNLKDCKSELKFINSMEDASDGGYYSNAAWTIPAHASIFSGKRVSEHNSTTEDFTFKAKNELVNYLEQKGFNSALVTENGLLTANLGFSRSFEEAFRAERELGVLWNDESWRSYDSFVKRWGAFGLKLSSCREVDSLRSFSKKGLEKILGLDFGEDFNSTHSEATVERIVRLLKNSGKSFVFSNFMITHFPYTFTQSERKEFLNGISNKRILKLTRNCEFHEAYELKEGLNKADIDVLRDCHKCSILYLDTVIEELYESIPENTFLVLIGDHGEIIGSEKHAKMPIVDHHFGTFEKLLRVPFKYKFKADDQEHINFNTASHTDFIDLVKSLVEGQEFSPSDYTISEYYGKAI